MSKKIKVLYTSELGSLTSGGQRSLLLLLDRLDREKYQPILISREDGDLPRETKAKGIFTVVKAPQCLRSMNIVEIFKTFKSFKALVKEQEIDLIHTDSPRWTFYLGIIAKSLKIPIVYHARVSTPEPGFYEWIIYSVSTKVIAVSEFAKKRFVGFSKADQKVGVIYNVVDTEKFSPQCNGSNLRGELGINNEVLIGVVGEITPNKGHKEFLQAAAKVTKDYLNVKFVIIGEDKDGYVPELKQLIEQLSIESYVVLLPARRDMPETIAALDILVNASYMEGFSRVIIEAMASGKAVVATDVGGNLEAVWNGETGILVEPQNPGQLTRAILTLARDEQQRVNMGEAGRKRVEGHFSLDTQIARIEAIYSQLTGA